MCETAGKEWQGKVKGIMESYCLNIGGIVLRVRRTERGWEPSVIGPATVLDEQTAKSIADSYGSVLV